MIQSMYTVKKKTAYVAGNMNFTQGDMIISADTGSFNWSTKNAVFNGNVIVNGEPKMAKSFTMSVKKFL